jgi:hypothetical protein
MQGRISFEVDLMAISHDRLSGNGMAYVRDSSKMAARRLLRRQQQAIDRSARSSSDHLAGYRLAGLCRQVLEIGQRHDAH